MHSGKTGGWGRGARHSIARIAHLGVTKETVRASVRWLGRAACITALLCALTGFAHERVEGHVGAMRAAAATYVAIGDSWTDGTCATNKRTDSFAAVLARYLPAGARYINLGVPGIVLDEALAVELPHALAAHPRFVTVWLADNDIGDGTPLPHYQASLDRLLDTLQRAHIQMFVANEPDLRLVPSYKRQAAFVRRGMAYNAAIAASIAAHGATMVDIYPATARLWGRADRVCRDGEHLNTKGYAALARIFYDVMHRSGAL